MTLPAGMKASTPVRRSFNVDELTMHASKVTLSPTSMAFSFTSAGHDSPGKRHAATNAATDAWQDWVSADANEERSMASWA